MHINYTNVPISMKPVIIVELSITCSDSVLNVASEFAKQISFNRYIRQLRFNNL